LSCWGAARNDDAQQRDRLGAALSYRDWCYRFYGKAVTAILPNGLLNAQYAYAETLSRRMPSGSNWLDLGCGHSFFGHWMVEENRSAVGRASRTIGLDLDSVSLKQHQLLDHRLIGDCGSIPFAPGTFDIVTANMVVEHLASPAQVLAEVRRVLRPGGQFVYHTPNVRNFKLKLVSLLPQTLKNLLARLLEGRAEEDVYPTHYRMNTPEAVRSLAAQAGFQVEEFVTVEDTASTIVLGPIAAIELLIIRMMLSDRFANCRSNLIVSLRNPAPG
jgi:ubiquinone/menaquinone biosynthesis C-methylase UbiE